MKQQNKGTYTESLIQKYCNPLEFPHLMSVKNKGKTSIAMSFLKASAHQDRKRWCAK